MSEKHEQQEHLMLKFAGREMLITSLKARREQKVKE